MSKANLYIASNVAFACVVLCAYVVRGIESVHPFYLIALFALCSSAAINMTRINDRYALLVVFSAVYFMFYGLTELIQLLFGARTSNQVSGLLSATESVILVGAALAQLSYRIICRAAVGGAAKPAKDWSERSMLIAGGTLWIVCTWMTWQFKVNIVVSTLSHDVSRGLGALNGWQAAAFILAIMLQPLGILIAAYAQSKFRRPYMMPIVVGMVLLQLLMGFVTDVKADAMTGALIVIIAKVLADGGLPKTWLVVSVVFLAIAFPVLQANRAVRGMSGADRNDAAQDIRQTVSKAMEASKSESTQIDSQQSFFERLSLVGSVQTIVTRTGNDVSFQNGYTLSPLVTTFIPRLVWPTKPDVQAGRIMNKEFQISPVADTYISPSHLGELYWNFGWAGVVIGMSVIGALLGYVGGRFNFENAVTLTHLMILLVTIRILVIGFEGTIAVQYTVWMRSMLAIALLHLVFAKAEAFRRGTALGASSMELLPLSMPAKARFPNLMR